MIIIIIDGIEEEDLDAELACLEDELEQTVLLLLLLLLL